MARKEHKQDQLPPEDWLHPGESNLVFDGSLLPEDPTTRYRHPPINPDPTNYREWWRKRHFFPEDDQPKQPTIDHHAYWRKTGLLPDPSTGDKKS